MTNNKLFPETEEGAEEMISSLGFDGRITKESLQHKADEDVQALLDSGQSDPLKLLIKMKVCTEYFGNMIKRLQPAAIIEAAKYAEGENTMYSIKFNEATSPQKYDYSDDDTWNELKEAESTMADKRKERELFLKKGIGTGGVVDDSSGEIINPPKLKSGGERILKVTISR